MAFAAFFTSLFNILLNSIQEVLAGLFLSIDGIIYNLLSYAFNLFLIMCQVNMDYVVALVGGLVDRIQAVVMVFIVFKLGIELIQYLLNPDDSVLKKGSELIKNIFITAALLISYTFIFGLVNDLSMLVIGSSGSYNYNTLSQIVDVSPEADEGLIMRFIFGKGSKVDDIGEYISYKTLSMFVQSSNGELEKCITEGDGYNFSRLSNIQSKVNKTVEYIPILSGLVGLYLIYSIALCSIQIGIRMFKIVVLQILAPIAIVSIIKDGMKGKTFSGYIKLYGATVADAFFRIASMLIVTVFICKFFLNLEYFFDSSTANSEGISSVLITVAVIVAGYKFANEIPAFINKALGTSLDEKGKGGFGSWMKGAIGLGVGGAIGLATGISNKAGVGGTLANMGLGMFNGAGAAAKGNGIAETFKNMKDVTNKSKARAADYGNRGFGNIVAGGVQNALGVGSSQDATMRRYDAVQTAIDELDTARTNAIKDTKMEDITSELSGAGFSGSYGEVKFGSDKDSYASSMLAYDNNYASAQAALKIAQDATYTDSIPANGMGPSITAEQKKNNAIAAAQKKLQVAKDDAIKRAGEIYNTHKDGAKSDEITYREGNLDSAAGKAGIKVKNDKEEYIGKRDASNAVTSAKQSLARKGSYRQTHGAPKDK